MKTFEKEDDLQAFLAGLGPLYPQYASSLWIFGVRCREELANASSATLEKAGVVDPLLNHIKAMAGGCNLVCKARKKERQRTVAWLKEDVRPKDQPHWIDTPPCQGSRPC